MTLRPGDRVRYTGPNEDYECAAGSVGMVSSEDVGVQWDGEQVWRWHLPENLEKVSGIRVEAAPRPATLWPLDMQDEGAKAHLARQADKAAAVAEYREDHLPFDESLWTAEYSMQADMDADLGEWPGFESTAGAVYREALALLVRKHSDYGPLNISRSPGGPLNGLRVRMWDKLARINNLVDSGATPENESLRDSFLDIANYGMIALLVLDGDWPDA